MKKMVRKDEKKKKKPYEKPKLEKYEELSNLKRLII